MTDDGIKAEWIHRFIQGQHGKEIEAAAIQFATDLVLTGSAVMPDGEIVTLAPLPADGVFPGSPLKLLTEKT